MTPDQTSEAWAMTIREVLLGMVGGVWAVAVLVTLVRTGSVPAELWAVPGVVVGALLAVFRADDRASRGRRANGHDDTEDTDL